MDTIAPLPLSSHAKPVDSFAPAADLEQELKRVVRGEVRFDRGSRAMYATDGSNYRQIPIGLVVPRDADDVVAAVAACRKFDAPVLARGAGTSLAGQCCNVAVVFDFTKYMNRILEIDPVGRFARVQPGVVLDSLRNAAEAHQLTFGPDPSTHSRCTLGGMIGNNSCGTHSLLAGKTVDNVEELEILLYDGTRLTVGATSDSELAAVAAEGGRRGEIYAGLRAIRDRYEEQIRARFPKIPRRVSGYNLDELLPGGRFNVARALVGTEGTCAIVLEAKVTLIPSPQHRSLVGLGYPDAFAAADHVPEILEFQPIGLEGFEGNIIDGLHKKGVPNLDLIPDGRGVLLVEFGFDNADEAEATAQRFIARMQQISGAPTTRLYSKSEARAMWKIRESGPRAAAAAPGAPLEWEGWDDAAVAPEKLGAYLRELRALLDEYHYRTAFYGHFGHGCIHMRVSFDLFTEDGIRKYGEFVERAADLVVSYGGSLSGEHGDGQSRGALLPKMFGSELMSAFRQFKAIWDPGNRMNPHKVIDAYLPTENLRLGADYAPLQPLTHFQFPEDGGSLAKAALRCVGLGECRKQDGGSMCPSYMVTLEEEHSTRGRAHMLFELLQGEVVRDGWKDEHVKRALDLCLSCKACKSECPTNVDIATYRAEFLSHYYEGRRRPLHAYAFGMVDRWLRLASFAPGLANALAARARGPSPHPPRAAPGAAAAAASTLADQLPAVGARPRRPDGGQIGDRRRAARPGDGRGPATGHVVGGHVQQLPAPGDQPGRARGARGRRLRRRHSRAAAVLRASALRLRAARPGETVPAIDHGRARRTDRRRDPADCPRAQLRVGVSRRAAQSVSDRCPRDPAAGPDDAAAGVPAVTGARVSAAASRREGPAPRALPSEGDHEDGRRGVAAAEDGAGAAVARFRLLWHGRRIRLRGRQIRGVAGGRRAGAAACGARGRGRDGDRVRRLQLS